MRPIKGRKCQYPIRRPPITRAAERQGFFPLLEPVKPYLPLLCPHRARTRRATSIHTSTSYIDKHSDKLRISVYNHVHQQIISEFKHKFSNIRFNISHSYAINTFIKTSSTANICQINNNSNSKEIT